MEGPSSPAWAATYSAITARHIKAVGRVSELNTSNGVGNVANIYFFKKDIEEINAHMFKREKEIAEMEYVKCIQLNNNFEKSAFKHNRHIV